MMRFALTLAALVLALLLGSATRVRAQTCTAAGPSLTLGTVNPYSTTTTTTSGNGTYTCTNPNSQATTIYACVSVGTGSGGITATNRALASGSSTAPIQIMAGGSSTQIGNGISYPMYGPITISVAAKSNANGTFPLSVNLPPPATAPAPGSYSSNFSGADAVFIYKTGSTSPTCSALNSGTHQSTQANFSISATVATQCTVSATSMAFPTASVLTNPVSATATISVTCNASTPVTLAIDNGTAGTNAKTRRMTSGDNTITYGIYQDAGFTMPWGHANSNTASLSSGTGTLTAYGQVPAQASPPPGSYTDVVNVTITY